MGLASYDSAAAVAEEVQGHIAVLVPLSADPMGISGRGRTLMEFAFFLQFDKGDFDSGFAVQEPGRWSKLWVFAKMTQKEGSRMALGRISKGTENQYPEKVSTVMRRECGRT